jgi:hypothetical protein
MLQALVAILLVGIGAVVLGVTAKSMGGAVRVIEEFPCRMACTHIAETGDGGRGGGPRSP